MRFIAIGPQGWRGCEIWPYRLMVRTEAFQALNRGSIPRRVTEIFLTKSTARCLFLF